MTELMMALCSLVTELEYHHGANLARRRVEREKNIPDKDSMFFERFRLLLDSILDARELLDDMGDGK